MIETGNECAICGMRYPYMQGYICIICKAQTLRPKAQGLYIKAVLE